MPLFFKVTNFNAFLYRNSLSNSQVNISYFRGSDHKLVQYYMLAQFKKNTFVVQVFKVRDNKSHFRGTQRFHPRLVLDDCFGF